MSAEAIATLIALLAVGALLLRGSVSGARARYLVGTVLTVSLGVAMYWADGSWPRPPDESEVAGRPIQVREEGYVSSQACQSCHPDQHASWHASYHRTMTRIATADNVIGRFDGEVVDVHGHAFRPWQRDGEFFIDPVPTDAEDGANASEQKVVMTTGFHHMQLYWYSLGENRDLAMAPIVWLREAERWIPELSSFLRPPTRHLQIVSGRWSYVCQECHATGQQPRLPADPEKDSIDTVVGEFGIACEACHGPGERHAEIHRNPIHRYTSHLTSGGADPTIVNPGRLDSERSSQVCGQCHAIGFPLTLEEEARATTTGRTYRPGDDLHQTRWIFDGIDRRSSLPRQVLASVPRFYQDRYWSDGMVRVSGREYNGLIDSPCHANATSEQSRLSCLSCHEMHPSRDDPRAASRWANDQLRSDSGDDMCLQCHEAFREAITRHTHHSVTSSGSRCQNCHMPHTTYGLLKAIRSHTIDSPRVQADLETGRPNACNACHLDRTLRWTARHLRERYGIPEPALSAEEADLAAGVLWLTRGDAGQRALAAWAAGWAPAQEASGTDWLPPFVAPLLEDPYDAVRYIAQRSLRSLPTYEDLEYDFLGPPRDRTASVQEVRARWRASRRSGEGPRSRLMLDAEGRLDLAQWKALRAKRDDSKVHLKE